MCVWSPRGSLVATGYSGAMGHPGPSEHVKPGIQLAYDHKNVDLNLDIVCARDSGWLLGIMSLGKWGPKSHHVHKIIL